MRIHQTLRSLVVAGLVLAVLSPGASAEPGPAYFASDNVQWLGGNPRHTGSSGGRLHEGYFYVTDPRGVFIYDVSKPASPVLSGSLTAPQIGTGTALSQEDPDTNGRILLVDAVDAAAPSANKLLVVDVSNKTAPRVIGSVTTTDHTWTCVADCTYAYGRTGGIIDLTTPSSPKVAANWKTTVSGSGYTHDFTEVAPGRLMSAGQHSFYIDTTTPTAPKKLTTIKTTFSSLGYHSALWPREGQDKFLVMGTEIAPSGANNTAGSDCQGDGELATYDTTAVLAEEQAEVQNPDGWGPADFAKVDFWEISGRGTYTDGRAPFHTLYCGHWFDTHPDWNNGGLIAMGHYDFGTRFLKVDQAGDISEVGWFQPVGGYTASAYWVTDDIVYVLDYRRGLDILRFVENPAGSALLKANNPTTRDQHGIAEHGCKTLGDPYGPTNETDGLMLPIPEDKRDGTHKIRAVGSAGGAPYDLDIWFHDEACVSMSGTGIASDSPDELGPIPEGAHYASVDLYTGPPTHVLVEIDP